MIRYFQWLTNNILRSCCVSCRGQRSEVRRPPSMATRSVHHCSSLLSHMSNPVPLLLLYLLLFLFRSPFPVSADSPTYLLPLPWQFTSGEGTLSVDPALSLSVSGKGGSSGIVKEGFDRYKAIIFKNSDVFSIFSAFRKKRAVYDVVKLNVIVHSASEDLQLGIDESYSLVVGRSHNQSIIGEATIEATTVFGALRGLETFSQLCTFDYGSKTVLIHNTPWIIHDRPRFKYRGLLLDTSRHYFPVDVIKHILESMSFAKLTNKHFLLRCLHILSYGMVHTQSGSAIQLRMPMKLSRINVMAEVDVPGHAESWGKGYPDLWPSSSCREPLDITKNFTFELISGILSDMRKIFPFELFHLGGDEVNTNCWTSTPHVKHWLQQHNMTAKQAYKYFVLKAQNIAISKDWTPVNWEETFNTFPGSLNRRTVVHNWLGPGVCPKAVARGFRCIFSNQGVWYLDHLDVTWDQVYTAEPLEGISDPSEQELVLGGEVCMWGETIDTSNVQQTIWPRAAAAAERLWSRKDATSTGSLNTTALPRLQYFRCLLNRRGVQAAPVTNFYARTQPLGPGSCYDQ
ncbi:hypothetical protein SAY86_005243 [Trapa natans]|uniref:Beta-hexosaminidase n=1 Tax=Trapa natans TaxID=22666 RepID=A0AAN7QUN7_TRANT|nr:hypothetical protein SAY86_005243 [Trapa natans]